MTARLATGRALFYLNTKLQAFRINGHTLARYLLLNP